MILPNDICRCGNENCDKKLICSRFLDVLPWGVYSFSDFNEKDCEFYIEYDAENRDKIKRNKNL